MCGIAAIFSLREKRNLKAIVPMARVVRHRGPDGEGFVFFPDFQEASHEAVPSRIALGHRRLSILDLSDAGSQPMATEDGKIWITYNGEIYNYIEIKRELESEGIAFNTKTDTEVLLKAYRRWGIRFLEKLNGMFSFVLVDLIKKRAYACRDRFGVKPLYYYRTEDGLLAFASEIKQFQELEKWKAKLNHQRAFDFLNFGLFDHTDETLFSDVRQVQGGHFAEIALEEQGGMALHRWYRLPDEALHIGYEEAVRRCHEILLDAVRIRLRSDVEVGSCLSGGIDSSTIVCLASRLLKEQDGRPPKTFSARSEDPLLDEYRFMGVVEKEAGSEGFYVTPKEESLLSEFDKLLWHQDEPFATTSVFAQWKLFSKVKEEKVKVMLDGQGADEQLGGYFEYYGIFLKQLAREGKILELLQEIKTARRVNPGLNPIRSLVKNFIPAPLKDALFYSMNKPSLKSPWIDFSTLQCKVENPFDQRSRRSFRSYSEDMLLSKNLPMLLHYEDRNSMAHSVESRTPFLDYRFVEFIVRLPPSYMIRDGMTKALLRDSMQGVVPKPILERKDKIAFATDERRWLGGRHKGVFLKAIREAVLETRLFNASLIPKMERMLEGRERFSFLPSRVIAFSQWMKARQVRL